MKLIKNYLYLLLAGAFVLFSACEAIEETPDEVPFDPLTVADLYLVSTYNPDINANQVTFKGNLLNADATVAYGFMWYIKPAGQEEPQIHRVEVGSGDMNGAFEKVMTTLPRGVEMVVCAFVDYPNSTLSVTNAIGEEIDFTYD